MAEIEQRYSFSVLRERLRQHAGPVLNFALGQLSKDLPVTVSRLVEESPSLVLRSANRDEVGEFTDSAAAYLQRVYDVEVLPTQILPMPGGRAAMTMLAASVLEPGDGVLVTEPGYPAFARVVSQHHASVHAAVLDPNRSFLPALEGLAAGDLASIRLVALNCPNNPTGVVLSADTVTAVTAGLAADTILFNDATYGPLVYGQQPISLLDSAVTRGRELAVLELHSLAKLFALGPLSMSFLVGTGSLVERLRQYCDFAWSPLSALRLQVATLCLQETRYLEEVRGDLETRLDRLRATLIEVGFEPYPTPAGIYVLTSTPETIGERSPNTAQEVADILLDDFGIAVASWDRPPNRYLRFAALCRPEDLAALASLKNELRLS